MEVTAPVTKPSKLSPETQEEGRARHWLDQPGKRLDTATSHVMVLLDVCAGLRTKLAALEAERPVSVEATRELLEEVAEAAYNSGCGDGERNIHDADAPSIIVDTVLRDHGPSTPLPEVESLVRELDALRQADAFGGAEFRVRLQAAWPTLSAALLQRKR